MKNLVLWQETAVASSGNFTAGLSAKNEFSDLFQRKVSFCVDLNQNQLFAVTSCGQIGRLELSQLSVTPMRLLCDLSSQFDAANEQWRWIEFVAELESLVCISSQGFMVTVQPESLAIDEIGRVENGILALAFTSSQEQVAIATGGKTSVSASNGSILIMNTQWEVLQEKYFSELFTGGASTLGNDWEVDFCQQQMTLKWRDDGRFLVLNGTFTKHNGTDGMAPSMEQKLVVLTESLDFHALGRLEDGRELQRLGKSLDWAPNHSLFATSETRLQGSGRNNKHFVVFFERNGLRHGEFQLPETRCEVQVVQLQWNIQSDVLAVLVHYHHNEEEQSKTKTMVLQLWTRRNYHWYLKQEELFQTDNGLVMAWDQEQALRLHLVDSSGRYFRREFTWDAMVSQDDNASAAVIDGAKLLVTPFAKAVVPPPFAMTEIPFESCINALLFVSPSRLLVLESSGKLLLVENYLDPQSWKIMPVVLQEEHSDVVIRGFLEVASVSEDERIIQVLVPTPKVTVLISIQDGVASVCSLPMPNKIARATTIIADAQNDGAGAGAGSCSSSLLIQSYDGAIFELSCAESFPELNDFQVVTRRVFGKMSAVEYRKQTILVALKGTKLFVNGQVICSVCSSFFFAGAAGFLLFTTVGNNPELRILPLGFLADARFDGFESRRIERGATLVAVVPSSAKVVLQLPRGNLECVVPRLLMLSLILHQVTNRSYASALELCRKHRVDANMIVDYDRPAFLDNLEHFVNEISPPNRSDRLCLFIMSLHNIDVWRTKFKSELLCSESTTQSSTEAPPTTNEEFESKVNVVCRALLEVLRRNENDQMFLFPLLTCAVKQSPPDYQTALAHVERLMQEDDTKAQVHLARKAIKYLIFLVNGEELFEQAIGTYNLRLMRVVLSFLERDPFEELEMIKKWEAIREVHYRKYLIDLHLGLFGKALEHLSAARLAGWADATTDKCMSLIESGKLFDRGLQLFPNTEAGGLHQQILRSKAQFLLQDSQFEAAAYVFVSTTPPCFRQAVECFRLAHSWQMAFVCASQHNALVLKKTEIKSKDNEEAIDLRALGYQLAEEMAGVIGGARDVKAIAKIYAEYCHDVEEAVSTLVNAKEWTEAMRLSNLYNRNDLILTEVKPSVLGSWEELCDEITTRQKKYSKLCTRLRTIREQKRLFRLHGVDGHTGGVQDDEDGSQSVFSHGSAASSAFSQASVSSVGSHNSSVAIGNFPMKDLRKVTSSHFFASSHISVDRMTNSGGGSSNTKRSDRAESKRVRKQRFKQGSLEEENFVAKQLIECIPSCEMTREVSVLTRHLVLFQAMDRAAKLQFAFEALLHKIRTNRPPAPLDDQALEVDVNELLKASETTPWHLGAIAYFNKS